jgi:hypothetical protein
MLIPRHFSFSEKSNTITFGIEVAYIDLPFFQSLKNSIIKTPISITQNHDSKLGFA